ncbi:MAG: hypothetical protein M2R45_00547 [Verrucomicrobia subdivision 3 bacterium]|nr:hypothetical protein [Limisphaerales bacterium]MCS1413575.1 hypothetical protein [Limisphaerales bacterium]
MPLLPLATNDPGPIVHSRIPWPIDPRIAEDTEGIQWSVKAQLASVNGSLGRPRRLKLGRSNAQSGLGHKAKGRSIQAHSCTRLRSTMPQTSHQPAAPTNEGSPYCARSHRHRLPTRFQDNARQNQNHHLKSQHCRYQMRRRLIHTRSANHSTHSAAFFLESATTSQDRPRIHPQAQTWKQTKRTDFLA